MTDWIVWAYDHGSLRLEHRCGYVVAYDTSVQVSDLLAAMESHGSCRDNNVMTQHN